MTPSQTFYLLARGCLYAILQQGAAELVANTLVFETRAKASQLCISNGWDDHQLPVLTLALGLRFRELRSHWGLNMQKLCSDDSARIGVNIFRCRCGCARRLAGLTCGVGDMRVEYIWHIPWINSIGSSVRSRALLHQRCCMPTQLAQLS